MSDKPRVRVMSSGVYMSDGLKNFVANLGTDRDKASHTFYADNFLSGYDLNTIYRQAWVAQSGVDIPAEDSVRNWRGWRAEAEQITAIEAVEKELNIKAAILRARKMSRLYGGAAIYINTTDSNPEQPLVPGPNVKVQSLIVLSNQRLRAKGKVLDISNPYYGKPEFYALPNGANSEALIHASRLVIFEGVDNLSDIGVTTDTWGGDSVLQCAYDALTQRDSTMANIASLVFESKVDVFKFAGFAALMAQDDEGPVTRRMHLNAAMKGINGSVVIDKEDDYEQKNASFAGLPEISTKMQEEVSGAFKIPVTRLFGRSAAGMSGSGDGDERVYYDRVGQDQRLEIEPAMAILDECIIYQALGSRPPEIYFEWRPLRQITESERADVFSKVANAARAIAGNNAGEIIPLDALSDSLVNELTELGVLPGLESRIAEYGSLGEQGLPPEGIEI